MDDQKLVHQANQIAAYFEAYPEPRAGDGVLNHIRKFWPPSHRAWLIAYRARGGEGLHHLVESAAEQIAACGSQGRPG